MNEDDYMDKFQEVRKEYPITNNQTYLDTPTTGMISTSSYKAMRDLLKHRYMEGTDIEEYFGLWSLADETRNYLAELINAESSEIVYGLSSSSLFNIFTNGNILTYGDNVVVYDNAYPAITYNWISKSIHGIDVRIVKSQNGFVSEDMLENAVDEKTKVMSVCHVDMGSGYRHDIERLGNFCRNKHIWLTVDATQSVGAMHIDVKKMKIDFLTASSYKWLQNILGIGFAFINTELLKSLEQSCMGWANTANRIHDDSTHYELSQTASRFEDGGLNFLGIQGLQISVQQYLKLGGEEIERYILQLVGYLYQKVGDIPDVSIYGNYDISHRSGIVCLNVPIEWNLSNFCLESAGVRANMLAKDKLRIGVHYYNNTSDIDALISFLLKRSKSQNIKREQDNY